MGSAAAPLTRDRLLPPTMVKAPATYTPAAARNTHIHTILCKSATLFFHKAISSFLKVYSLLCSSRIHPSFFDVAAVATISAHFSFPAVNFFFFSPLLLLFFVFSQKTRPLGSICLRKGKSQIARCSADATGFFSDFFVTLRDIFGGRVTAISADGTTNMHTQMDTHDRRRG